MKYLLFTLYILWAACSGTVEAILYSKKGASAFKWNEHVALVIQRILVVDMIFCTAYMLTHGMQISFSDAILSFIIMVFSFSLPHDGAYYITRHEIDNVIPYTFWSKSKTSTAIIELGPVIRIALFIVAVVGLILL